MSEQDKITNINSRVKKEIMNKMVDKQQIMNSEQQMNN